MVKHNPRILTISFGLHSSDYTCSTPYPINQHLEKKIFLPKNLAKKTTFLDVIVMTLGFQLKNVDVTPTRTRFEH
jgi:hypothetical protein